MDKNKKIMVGKQSIIFHEAPVIISEASICGPKEAEGPLAEYFDVLSEDAAFGQDTWEEAESYMVKQAVTMAISKACLKKEDIRYIFAGDLLGQLIATTFGIKEMNIPAFGLYGACSTCGESLSLSAMTVAAGYADYVVAATSSHYGGAEKQFRFPLEYGNQRPLSTTWTVTGSGAFVVGMGDICKSENEKNNVYITGITTGKIVDYGIKDSFNMGACMAPAAADVIYQNLCDFNVKPTYYDKIITGDLGKIGKHILLDLLDKNNVDIHKQHMDCGIEIYNNEEQDTHSGGSGCGCSAITLAGYILKQLRDGIWKRVLFVPTGALLSTVSYNEGQNIPGIAHAVILESR
jgi:stage V sporulation protein AD